MNMSFKITNIETYKAIALEAYEEMINLDSSSKTPKADGSDGFIIKYDPEHKSFKKSMIVVVFTGMWLEALLHLKIVKIHGESEFKKVDRKYSYEEKLKMIGVSSTDLLNKVKRLRETRKELVHEKAFLDNGEIKKAQQEAVLANEVMNEIIVQISQPQG